MQDITNSEDYRMPMIGDRAPEFPSHRISGNL